MTKNKKHTDILKYKVTPAGSLGLLALGHIGIEIWRGEKNKLKQKKKTN